MQAMLPSVHGMLPAMFVLAVPAFVICLGIGIAVYRRRH
jgi:hypothetical protein